MSELRAVFFDFDETLVTNTTPIQILFQKVYEQFEQQFEGADKQRFFEVFRNKAGTLWDSMFDRPLSPEAQFIECFAESLIAATPLSDSHALDIANKMAAHYVELSANNVRLHEGAQQALAELSDAGFITGIITNGIEQLQLAKIHALDVHQWVDHVVVSAHARAHKPSTKVFQHALEVAGVEASNAWQVGDHATNDVAGAIRAGLGGIFYDPRGDRLDSEFKGLPESPTHVIQHLNEIVDLAKVYLRN